MNLDGIDVFVKVVQAGSFTAAAKLLNMPTTTVSGKVAQLERRLGVTLLQRTTRKLNLTQAGSKFFSRCVKALEEVEAGESELTAIKAEPQGLLKITTVADLGHSLMPDLIRGYLKKYPQMKVELILTTRVVDLIGEGIDLALRTGNLEDSTLIAKKFYNDELGLWASPAYLKKNGIPKAVKDLKKHQFIKFSSSPRLFKTMSDKDAEKLVMPSRIFVDDMETMKAFVLGGDGIGTLPGTLADKEEKAGKIVRVLPGWRWGAANFYFVYPPQRFVSLKVQTFIEHALQTRAERKDL
ncbi:hypothetical protein AZI85_01440 [Bdellovibrio bacteriovorus]|uniref:HTH lysR-type domain-containing protein n=1 Tax=Bdellovibrio bacteriovorus TaxID=959 RepID=A0A150WW40_BDEBC|nr:LysR family transcriptional regulator [Bdellovibrio bacteriovorus]KYG70626.1 hypothetical protein AZI85_01440 [Bdellovibrio bacteriovorus]